MSPHELADGICTLDGDNRSTGCMTRFPFFHSDIGIQPAKTGGKLNQADHATGLLHVAPSARNRKEAMRKPPTKGANRRG